MISLLEIRALESGYDPDKHKENLNEDEFLTYCVLMSKFAGGSIACNADIAYRRVKEYMTTHPSPYSDLDYCRLATWPDVGCGRQVGAHNVDLTEDAVGIHTKFD